MLTMFAPAKFIMMTSWKEKLPVVGTLVACFLTLPGLPFSARDLSSKVLPQPGVPATHQSREISREISFTLL